MTTFKEKVGDKREEKSRDEEAPRPAWAGMSPKAPVLVSPPPEPEPGCVALGEELNLSGLALQITISLTRRQGVAK